MYKFYEKLKRKKKYSKEFHQDVAEKNWFKARFEKGGGEIRKRLKIEGNPVRNENFHSHKLMWANYFPS